MTAAYNLEGLWQTGACRATLNERHRAEVVGAISTARNLKRLIGPGSCTKIASSGAWPVSFRLSPQGMKCIKQSRHLKTSTFYGMDVCSTLAPASSPGSSSQILTSSPLWTSWWRERRTPKFGYDTAQGLRQEMQASGEPAEHQGPATRNSIAQLQHKLKTYFHVQVKVHEAETMH